MTSPETYAARRRTALWIAGGVGAFLIVSCVVLGVIASVLFPTNTGVRIENQTQGELTEVRLLRATRDGDREIARFARIGASESVTVEDADLGTLAVEYSDARGRWRSDRAISRDEDDVRGRAPSVIRIDDSWVDCRDVRRLR